MMMRCRASPRDRVPRKEARCRILSVLWHCRRFSLTMAVLAQPAARSADRVIPNDNRVAAGTLRNGVLTLHLEARKGTWFPDGDDGPSLALPMFAEVGRAPQNPGPLIRVPAGTRIRVSIRNALRDSVLIVYGLHTRPAAVDDTVQVAAGRDAPAVVRCRRAGDLLLLGHDNASADRRSRWNRQSVARRVRHRPAGTRRAADRIFVLGSWIGPEDAKRLSRPSSASSTDCRGRTRNASRTPSATRSGGGG